MPDSHDELLGTIRTRDGEPRRLVFLHPGIFATPAFFEPLVPVLVDELDCAVVSFAPRGMGANRERVQGQVNTRTRAADLLEWAQRAARAHPDVPIAFLGHSFGGTVIYHALVRASGAADAQAWYTRVDRVATLASPSRLEPQRDEPWSRLFTPRTKELVQQHERGGWIDFHRFVVAQKQVSTHWIDRLPLAPGQVAFFMDLARRFTFVSGATLMLRVPSTFLHARGDFTARSFRDFLRAGATDRDSAELVTELIDSGLSGAIRIDGEDLREAFARLGVPAMTVGSPKDELVTPDEARMDGARNELLEGQRSCGHAGYLYRPESFGRVCDLVREFLG